MKKIISIISVIVLIACLLSSCIGPLSKDQLFDGKTPKDLYGQSINKYKNHKDQGIPYSINIAWSKDGAEPQAVIDLIYDGDNFKFTISEGSSTEEIIFKDNKMYFKDKNGGKHYYDTTRNHVEKYVTEKTLVKDLTPAFPDNIPDSWFDDLEFIPSEDAEYYTVIADSKKEKNHPLYKDFYESDVVCRLYFTKDGILEKIELENVTVRGEKSNVTVTISWSDNNQVDAPDNSNDFSHKGEFDFDKGHIPGDDNRPSTHTHSFGEWATAKEATCEEDGLEERMCSCGEIESQIIPATDHTFNSTILEEHSSSSIGYVLHSCINCDYSYPEPIDHSYSPINVVEPTCENEGYTEYACTCGITIVKDVTARIGHIPGDREYLVNETVCDCEWANPWISFCTMCGITCEQGTDGAYGHVYKTWMPAEQEDWISPCEQEICETAECENCDCHPGFRVVAPAPGHSWSEWQEAIKDPGLEIPDCEWIPIYVRECESCGQTEAKMEGSAPGHTYINGYCSTCGKADPDYDFEYSVGLEFTPIDDNTCYVSGIGTCPDTDLVIPSVAPDGKTVVAIGENAFHCPITSVIIPDSVKTIGPSAFSACISLVYVDIGNGVEYIAAGAFHTCTQLKSIVIGKSILGILERAFEDCNSLTNVYYKGSDEEWEEIWIYVADDSNQDIFNATRYYYSKTKPTEERNFWRYVDGVPTPW